VQRNRGVRDGSDSLGGTGRGPVPCGPPLARQTPATGEGAELSGLVARIRVLPTKNRPVQRTKRPTPHALRQSPREFAMMTQSGTGSLARVFRDVDAAAPGRILQCLDTLQTMEAGRAYKARALEHLGLGPSSVALDVACGLGDDVVRMRARCARAVGVDRSHTL